MRVEHKELRRMGITTNEDCMNFRRYCLGKHDQHMPNDYDSFFKLINEVTSTDFSAISTLLGEWQEREAKAIKAAEAIEDFLYNQTKSYFENLDEYGYVFEARNISRGDSSNFEVDDKLVKVTTKTHATDLGLIPQDNNTTGIKQSLSWNILRKAIDYIIDKEIEEAVITEQKHLSKKSVKIVFDNLLIRKTERGTYAVVIRFGIKVL